MGAVEDYLEKCADITWKDVPIQMWTLRPWPILLCSTRGGSNISKLFDTAEKKGPCRGKQKAWLERQGEKAALQERWQNEWHDVKYQGIVAEAPPCSERTSKKPLLQHSSSSSRDEESQWVAVEDRRRRRVAFEETAKDMLRHLEDSEGLKESDTEMQEQLGISEEAGVSIKQVAPQARNENGHFFEIF